MKPISLIFWNSPCCWHTKNECLLIGWRKRDGFDYSDRAGCEQDVNNSSCVIIVPATGMCNPALTFISLPRMSTFSRYFNFLYWEWQLSPSFIGNSEPTYKFSRRCCPNIPLNIYITSSFLRLLEKQTCLLLFEFELCLWEEVLAICYFRRDDSTSKDFRSRPRTSKTCTYNSLPSTGITTCPS